MPRAVLIVDDSPTIRGFARLFLRPLQLEVKEAADGAQALEIVRAEPPALAIVDVNMPGMDGLSFTREVRSDARVEIARVPIVLLTGDRLDDMREKGRIVRASMGVAMQTLTPELAEALKLKEDTGALIGEVMPKSPAEKGGIKSGDVITAVNGRRLKCCSRT